MARHTVIWSPIAEQQLTQIRLDATDRDAVTRAVHRVERHLVNDPVRFGESRGGATRAISVPLLTVYFEVSHTDRIVEVVKVTTP
jgi:hypothetical protein